MVLLLFSGCGIQEDFAPIVGDVRIVGFPQSDPAYQVGFNEGTVPVVGRVDFEDPDGDVLLLHVRWQDCGSGPLKTIDNLQEDFRESTTGTFPFVINISTDCPIGFYEIMVSVSDGQGNHSNTLKAVYEIYL